MSRLYGLLLICLVLGVLAPAAWAEQAESQPEKKKADEGETKDQTASMLGLIGVCFGAGACAIGGGLAIAKVGSSCIEAIARQPEAAGSMFAPMMVTAAMIEGGMLFAIVVCLLGVLSL